MKNLYECPNCKIELLKTNIGVKFLTIYWEYKCKNCNFKIGI